MGSLADVLAEEVRAYASDGNGFNLRLYPLLDDEHQTYAVVAVDTPIPEYVPLLVVFARVENNTIIIESDATDHPLSEALLQRGIERQQIVLAHAGELHPNKTDVP